MPLEHYFCKNKKKILKKYFLACDPICYYHIQTKRLARPIRFTTRSSAHPIDTGAYAFICHLWLMNLLQI